MDCFSARCHTWRTTKRTIRLSAPRMYSVQAQTSPAAGPSTKHQRPLACPKCWDPLKMISLSKQTLSQRLDTPQNALVLSMSCEVKRSAQPCRKNTVKVFCSNFNSRARMKMAHTISVPTESLQKASPRISEGPTLCSFILFLRTGSSLLKVPYLHLWLIVSLESWIMEATTTFGRSNIVLNSTGRLRRTTVRVPLPGSAPLAARRR